MYIFSIYTCMIKWQNNRKIIQEKKYIYKNKTFKFNQIRLSLIRSELNLECPIRLLYTLIQIFQLFLNHADCLSNLQRNSKLN